MSDAHVRMPLMRLIVDALEVRSARAAIVERCETVIENAGGCVVAISTSFPLRGVVLNCAYLADFAAAPLAASYLLTGPGRPREMWQRVIADEPLGAGLSRASLLDHATVLHECLERLWDESVSVTVAEDALKQSSEVWLSSTGTRG
jgi:hypothetical protein